MTLSQRVSTVHTDTEDSAVQPCPLFPLTNIHNALVHPTYVSCWPQASHQTATWAVRTNTRTKRVNQMITDQSQALVNCQLACLFLCFM